MLDLTTAWRDFQERPITFPLLSIYMNFLSIQRYEHMPFYFYPQGQKVVSFEDGVLRFLDFVVDAHELERNKQDFNKTFYARTRYVLRNFHRYSNDTMANVMFDTQLRKCEYDRLNSVVDRQTALFYGSTSLVHVMGLSYTTYLLRYRTLSKPQVLAVGTAMYFAFNEINSIAYKLFVDRHVINEARSLGLSKWVQANGSSRVRGHNY